MPRPRAADPLVPLRLRVRQSVAERIQAEAAAADCTVSDYVRRRVELLDMQPTGATPPAKRAPRRAVPARDPAEARLLAGIGNNINQLARALNAERLAGKRFDFVGLAAQLAVIERHLRTLADAALAPPSGGRDAD